VLTAVILAIGVLLGVPPAFIAVGAVAAVEPRIVLAGAAVWAGMSAFRRRASRVTPDDEATYFRALAAELRSGNSLRGALGAAANRVPGLPLDRTVRLAAAGLPMVDVANEVEERFPENGPLAAAAFRLSDWSGARVADAFEDLADRAADAAEMARERRAATAQARVSALIVGVAPLAFTALLLATGRTSGLLAHGNLGWIVLIIGVALEAAGLLLVAVIVRRAER